MLDPNVAKSLRHDIFWPAVGASGDGFDQAPAILRYEEDFEAELRLFGSARVGLYRFHHCLRPVLIRVVPLPSKVNVTSYDRWVNRVAPALGADGPGALDDLLKGDGYRSKPRSA